MKYIINILILLYCIYPYVTSFCIVKSICYSEWLLIIMKLILALLLLSAVYCRTYTLYKQCDASWKSDQLGTSTSTICSAGCLISSVAMMINTYGVKVNSSVTNPHSMNIWLKSNGGYVSGNLFVWGSINKLGFVF